MKWASTDALKVAHRRVSNLLLHFLVRGGLFLNSLRQPLLAYLVACIRRVRCIVAQSDFPRQQVFLVIKPTLLAHRCSLLRDK